MKTKKGLILLALFLTVVISAVLLPVADALLLLFNWVDENRSISWLVFIIFYVMATVLVLPGSLLTLAAGFLFGLGYGFAIVSLASNQSLSRRSVRLLVLARERKVRASTCCCNSFRLRISSRIS